MIKENEYQAKTSVQNDTAELWQSIIPAMPDYIPLEPNYKPLNPTRVFPVKNLGTAGLSRKIYLDMLRMVQTYSQLLLLAPPTDTVTINSLRLQMNLLSISMLNIYQTLSQTQNVPRLISWWTPLPNNYASALQIAYNRVFNIYLQTLTLFNQTATFGSNVSTTLIIIINNLKNQLKVLQNLIDFQTALT